MVSGGITEQNGFAFTAQQCLGNGLCHFASLSLRLRCNNTFGLCHSSGHICQGLHPRIGLCH